MACALGTAGANKPPGTTGGAMSSGSDGETGKVRGSTTGAGIATDSNKPAEQPENVNNSAKSRCFILFSLLVVSYGVDVLYKFYFPDGNFISWHFPIPSLALTSPIVVIKPTSEMSTVSSEAFPLTTTANPWLLPL